MNLKIIPLALITLIAGCTSTYPVYIKNNATSELFVGKAVSQLVGESAFSVTNADGVTCNGTYDAEVTVTGGDSSSGPIICSDGRTGQWAVAGDLTGGQGIGKLDGEKIIIMYGRISRQSLMEM